LLSAQKTFENDNLKALSLFTGAGGLDIGFHRAGFNIVACIEIEPLFCQTLKRNTGRYFPEDCRIICDDVRHIDPACLGIDHVDVIIGGPPCQSFSAAGRRVGGVTGVLDVRGSLFEHYCHFVSYFRPRAFIFENVRGILQANKGRDWQEILARFASLGYSLFYKVLDAADYGVPQHRERLILVGIDGGIFLFPRPTHGEDSPDHLPYVSAYEAMKDLQPEDEPVYDYGGKYGKLLQEVPPGMNYHYFTKEMGYPEPIFAWRSRFSDFLYKADPDKPVKTLVARLGRYSGPFHWKSRKFTLAEFKRLQSFPDDYELAGTLNAQLQQLGNSVAPRFSEALALALRAQVFEEQQEAQLLPGNYRLSFDRRKSIKARHTRLKRLAVEDKAVLQPPLFAYSGVHNPLPDLQVQTSNADQIEESVYYFRYTSAKKRFALKEGEALSAGTFRFEFRRCRDILHIHVSKGTMILSDMAPALEYQLVFRFPLRDGIKKVLCSLWTTSGNDVPLAWDAIELALRKYSNYHSLMDIYGHFTEPHPIFSLTCALKNKPADPIMRFAAYFADFGHTMTVLPAEKLKQIMGLESPVDFLETVKDLRQLRFDVRVHETNLTIPQGMFRCCYPFTLSIDKQISVSWKEREHGNHRLVL